MVTRINKYLSTTVVTQHLAHAPLLFSKLFSNVIFELNIESKGRSLKGGIEAKILIM